MIKNTLILLLISLTLSCNSGIKNKNEKLKHNSNSDTIIKEQAPQDTTKEETVVVVDNGNIAIISSSCIDTIFRTNTNGLKYRFIEQNNGKTPEIGDILSLDIEYFTEHDSLLFSSYDVPDNFRLRLEKPAHRGSIEEAFMMMHKGDSAIFKVNAYNFYRYSRKLVNIPEFIKPNELIVFFIRLKEIQHSETYEEEKYLREAEIREEEISMINRFLISEDLTSKELQAGIHLIILEEGKGTKLKAGDLVKFHYEVSFLDGLVFDNTYDSGMPLIFELGSKQLIPGLEIALSHLHVGDKAKIIIPFALAYGSESKGPIPPYSTLVFDVEIISANA